MDLPRYRRPTSSSAPGVQNEQLNILLIYNELQYYPEGFLRDGSIYVICKKSGLTIGSEETCFAEYQLPSMVVRKSFEQNPRYCQNVS